MTSPARLILIAVVLILMGATGFWVHRYGRPRSFLFNTNQTVKSSGLENPSDSPTSADNDSNDNETPFDYSDPDFNPACEGILRGHFLALAQKWDSFLKANPEIDKNPKLLEERRKSLGLPLLVWKSDLEGNESADPNSIGTNVLERPHACGTTQIQFAGRLPDGKENFDLESEERSPFPTDFAAEIVDGKLKTLWPLEVDGIPLGIQGTELLVRHPLRAICADCKKNNCPSHKVIYGIQPTGEFHVSNTTHLPEPKTVACAPIEELKIMQYDSCREIKDQKSGATRVIYYQSPCT